MANPALFVRTSINRVLVPDFEDDFSVDNWTDRDSAQIGVSGGVLKGIGLNDNTDDTSFRALGLTLSDTAWVLRCKYQITVYTTGSLNPENIIYLTIADNDAAQNSSQDAILFATTTGALDSFFFVDSADGGNLPSSGGSDKLTTTPTVITYALELKRLTATTVTAEIFNNLDYTDSVESKAHSPAATVINLDTAKMQNIVNTFTPDSNVTIEVDNLQIFDGVTSV